MAIVNKEILANYLKYDQGFVQEAMDEIKLSNQIHDEKPVHDILADCPGSYKWGERDCLLMIDRLITAHTGHHTPYPLLHRYSEKEAFKKCIDIFGSIMNAHDIVIRACGLKRLDNLQSFSVVISCYGHIKNTTESKVDVDRNYKCIPLICDDSFTLWGYDINHGFSQFSIDKSNITHIYGDK